MRQMVEQDENNGNAAEAIDPEVMVPREHSPNFRAHSLGMFAAALLAIPGVLASKSEASTARAKDDNANAELHELMPNAHNLSRLAFSRTHLITGTNELGVQTSPATLRRYQHWIDIMRIPTPPVDVRLINSRCTDAEAHLACTRNESPLTIWLADDDPKFNLTPQQEDETIRHEIGHVIDYKVMDNTARSAFQTIMGTSQRPWRDGGGSSPHEQFAEAAAFSSYAPKSLPYLDLFHRYIGGYGYYPTRQQFKAVRQLILRQFRKYDKLHPLQPLSSDRPHLASRN